GEGRSFLTALIVPNWEQVRFGLRRRGLVRDQPSNEQLAEHPAVRQFLEERLAVTQSAAADWERVKRFAILSQPFSVAQGELTMNLKLRREEIYRRHQVTLEALYGG